MKLKIGQIEYGKQELRSTPCVSSLRTIQASVNMSNVPPPNPVVVPPPNILPVEFVVVPPNPDVPVLPKPVPGKKEFE